MFFLPFTYFPLISFSFPWFSMLSLAIPHLPSFSCSCFPCVTSVSFPFPSLSSLHCLVGYSSGGYVKRWCNKNTFTIAGYLLLYCPTVYLVA
jgi:hypothetical protein